MWKEKRNCDSYSKRIEVIANKEYKRRHDQVCLNLHLERVMENERSKDLLGFHGSV